MSLGKLGRPPEDRLLRQREIYQAASPLILQRGVRAFSMREAAEVAFLSVGGLYHYFPTKRDLVLHGIQTDTLQRLCLDFHEQFSHLAHVNPQQYFDVFYSHLIESALFMRPSVYAATELQVDRFTVVSQSIDLLVAEFVESLRLLDPTLPEDRLNTLARAIRRFVLAAIVDTSSTSDELHNEFYLLIGGYLSFSAHSQRAFDASPSSATMQPKAG